MVSIATPERHATSERGDRWGRLTTSTWFPYVAAIPLVVVLWGYVVRPIVETFRLSLEARDGGFTLENYQSFLGLSRNATSEALLMSVWISVLSVVCAGIVGTALAFLLQRFEFPGRRALEVFALVPMALPPLIGVVAFVFLYSESGIVPRAIKTLLGLSSAPFSLHGVPGVLVVHTFTMYPLFYLAVATALEGLDPSLEEAAYNLGGSRAHVWRRVLLPLLTPALVAGALLVFMVSMSSYTAPLLFGVDRMMTVQIALARTNGNLPLASAQSSMLSFVSIAFLLLMRWYQGRRSYRSVSKGAARYRREVRSPLASALALVGALLLTTILVLPIITLALISFSRDGSWTVQVLPPQYTLQNYVSLFTNPRTWAPIRNSLQMSLLATLAAVGLGVSAAYVVGRFQLRGRSLIDVAVMLPWALPGTVVGINLIAAFNTPTVFGLGNVLVGTFWILPLAYFVRFSPLVFRSSSAALAQVDPSLEEAARNLGASWWYAFRRVTLPLIGLGILSGALLAFVHGVGEFVASVLIYTAGTQPISVEIYNRMYQFQFGTAAAYGMLQVLLILVVLVVSRRMMSGATIATS
jgi:iron(III) transport system permease protein